MEDILSYIVLYFVIFGIPIIMLLLSGISMYRYFSAKKNGNNPEAFSVAEIKRRKKFFLLTTILTVVICAIYIGIYILLSHAMAHM